MSKEVAVQKLPDTTAPVRSFFEDMRNDFEALEQRAFDLFKNRGGEHGRALDDWLAAEREMFEIPQSELTEDKKAVHVRTAMPGLTAADVEVTATPRELVIRGATSSRNKESKGDARLSEFSSKTIYRRHALPTEVEVGKTKANLDDGMLTVDMPKKAPTK